MTSRRIGTIQSHFGQGTNGRSDAVLATFQEDGEEDQWRRDAIAFCAELQLTSLQLAEHFSEKSHEGGESGTGRVPGINR